MLNFQNSGHATFSNLFDSQPLHSSVAALCERHGVAHLALFGSANGESFNSDTSDFDFLVELDRQSPGSRARRWIAVAEGLESSPGPPCRLGQPTLHSQPVLFAGRQ